MHLKLDVLKLRCRFERGEPVQCLWGGHKTLLFLDSTIKMLHHVLAVVLLGVKVLNGLLVVKVVHGHQLEIRYRKVGMLVIRLYLYF